MEMRSVHWKRVAKKKYKQTAQWYYKNMGKGAATKFVQGIEEDTFRISVQPYIGQIEPLLNDQAIEFRSLVSHKHTKIIYYIYRRNVYIVDLWDCRQDNTL